MPEEEKKNKGGRPPKKIDQAQFESLCALQCTKIEICAVLHVSDKTLDKWISETYDGQGFSDVFAIKRQVGFVSLRRAQFKLAKTNGQVNIFMAKNFLGQSDKPGGDNTEREDDGFLKALKEEAGGAWQE